MGGVLIGCKGDGWQQGGEGQSQGMWFELCGVGGYGWVFCYIVLIVGCMNFVDGMGEGESVWVGKGCYIIL